MPRQISSPSPLLCIYFRPPPPVQAGGPKLDSTPAPLCIVACVPSTIILAAEALIWTGKLPEVKLAPFTLPFPHFCAAPKIEKGKLMKPGVKPEKKVFK